MKFEGAPAKSENISGPEMTRRQILESLAAITAVAAIGASPEAKAETNSFSEWKKNMENSKQAQYVKHPDVQLGEDFKYRLRGVSHVPETVIQNYNDIASEVEESSAVILEYFGKAMSKVSDIESISECVAGGEGNLKEDVESTLFMHQTNDMDVGHRAAAFFGCVGGMAARNNKDVFVINPQTRESQERGDLGMRRPLFAAGLGAAGIISIIREIQTSQKKPSEEVLTRRDFLRRGVTGAALAGSVGTYTKHAYLENLSSDWENEQKNKLEAVKSGVNGMTEKGLITHDDSPEKQADKLIWCMNDWRNAVTALGILQMNQHDAQVQNDSEKYMKGDGPLVHFEGAMHVGVQDYLRNSKLTEERVNFYNDTFNEDGNLSIRRFRFNKETERFDMLSEDPIIYKENGDI